MLKTLSAVNTLLGTLLALVVVGLLAAGSWIAYRAYHADRQTLRDAEKQLAERDARIAGLTTDLAGLSKELEAKQREIDRLNVALQLLKVDHRVAHLDVVDQKGSAAAGDVTTTVRFVEVDDQGRPLEEPRIFQLEGDMAYVESWVVKFSDEHVEMGDPLRSTSLCLFRRLFGEKQQPSEGFSLDPVGSRPAGYRSGGKASALEEEIWAKFWEYANDAALAEKAGVRAAHGEAPFQKLVPGKRYKILLRASGGLTFQPEDQPADGATSAASQTL